VEIEELVSADVFIAFSAVMSGDVLELADESVDADLYVVAVDVVDVVLVED